MICVLLFAICLDYKTVAFSLHTQHGERSRMGEEQFNALLVTYSHRMLYFLVMLLQINKINTNSVVHKRWGIN